MCPTSARIDCSITMRRIPCANARTSERRPASPPSRASTASCVPPDTEHDVSEAAALENAEAEPLGQSLVRPRDEVVTEPKRSRRGSRWANDSGGRRMNLVSVRTTVPLRKSVGRRGHSLERRRADQAVLVGVHDRQRIAPTRREKHDWSATSGLQRGTTRRIEPSTEGSAAAVEGSRRRLAWGARDKGGQRSASG